MNKTIQSKIDFVLPWVNGLDPQWNERFKLYSGSDGDSDEIRFRDWGLLRYWFRAVEKYTPWFQRIHFITSGELPGWLDISHPRLNWVKHEDYIPKEYLPTFSANTIELNLHRIKGLSEQFVYFNDDCFITKAMAASRFFRKELPCDSAILTAKPSGGGIIHMAINDLDVLDRHFSKRRVMKSNFSKWYSLKYGKGLLNNILLSPWREFPGFIDPHMPNAFLKSTLTQIWEKESGVLDSTCRNKFRTNSDVNQWLIRYWQLAEGRFSPVNKLRGTLCSDINEETIQYVCKAVGEQKYDMICLNDSTEITDFDGYRKLLQNAFETIMPEKSTFEK